PLVARLAEVDPLVALEADQLAAGPPGQRLGDLGLAHTGLALEEERPVEAHRQEDRRGEALVGQVVVVGERGADVVDGVGGGGVGAHTRVPASSSARRTRTRARWRRYSSEALRSADGSVPSSAIAAASEIE